jgi:hypothetical protein
MKRRLNETDEHIHRITARKSEQACYAPAQSPAAAAARIPAARERDHIYFRIVDSALHVFVV